MARRTGVVLAADYLPLPKGVIETLGNRGLGRILVFAEFRSGYKNFSTQCLQIDNMGERFSVQIEIQPEISKVRSLPGKLKNPES